jgi:glycosyltransferase involved in cell wall biosynthesis
MNFEPIAIFPKDFVWPRISMVTAVYNGAAYLEATICSLLQQGYPNLEYIIIDDGSTDRTPEIIRKYERHLTYTTRHTNRGLYASLNVGYARSTGEIMGWLNASDMLHVNGLFVVGSVFAQFADIKWITGRPTLFSSSGMTVQVAAQLPRWSRYPFLFATKEYVPGLASTNQYIQQESTFWRRGLWEVAGGSMETAYRAEGDFDLWVRFFRHAPLYSVDALIGGYRRHEDALSSSNIDRYSRTCETIVERELDSVRWGKSLKLFKRLTRSIRQVPIVRWIWGEIAVRGLYHILSRSRPPILEHNNDKWVINE